MGPAISMYVMADVAVVKDHLPSESGGVAVPRHVGSA
jgi:hypothetical protein